MCLGKIPGTVPYCELTARPTGHCATLSIYTGSVRAGRQRAVINSSPFLRLFRATMTVVQVDPNFKSSLPPRKRAKTQEEKEQRRVERILRNRRAAHASREKKRKHVEHLEAYVIALEQNLQVVQGNLAAACKELPQATLAALNLPEPEDLSELKARIHANLTCTAPDAADSSHSFNDDMDADERDSSPTPVVVKAEPVEDSAALGAVSGFYNYLSPVSINSPVNSPIDLTLKRTAYEMNQPSSPASPHSPELSLLNPDGLMLAPAASGPDYMVQNSEVILHPRLLAV